MTVDFSSEVERMARLARVTLEPQEKRHLAGQLSGILEKMRLVQEADTTGVEPTFHVISPPLFFREDEVEPALPLNRVLQNAPHRLKHFFQVPRITGGEQDET